LLAVDLGPSRRIFFSYIHYPQVVGNKTQWTNVDLDGENVKRACNEWRGVRYMVLVSETTQPKLVFPM